MTQSANINVASLNDKERKIVLEVLRRDEKLRTSDEKRVRKLKSELQEIRKKGAKKADGKYSEKTCGRCQEALTVPATSANQCKGCNHPVCQKCRTTKPDGSWVCVVCSKVVSLKKSSGDWFYTVRVNRFMRKPGHDLVRTSLQDKSESKKQESAGVPSTKGPQLKAGVPSSLPKPPMDIPNPGNLPLPDLPLPFLPTWLPSWLVQLIILHFGPKIPNPLDMANIPSLPVQGLPVGAPPLPAGGLKTPASNTELPKPGVGSPKKSSKSSDKSKSTAKQNNQTQNCTPQEDEEEEDIDSLVEMHKKTAISLHTTDTSGSQSSQNNSGNSVDVKGGIKFSLSYDEKSQTLSVVVKECHGLAHADSAKKRSNPFVKCHLRPDKSHKKKTAIKHNTVSPTFNETLKFSVSHSQLPNCTLHLAVWHYERFSKNIFLGEVELPLQGKKLGSLHEESIPLRGKAPPTAKSSAPQPKGDLVISLKYVPGAVPVADGPEDKTKKKEEEGGELHVLIKEAKNLKSEGTSDSYVKGALLPSKEKNNRKKTQVVKKTLNPHYDDTFVYKGTTQEQLKEMFLELSVWDRDFLGGVCLSVGGGKVQDTDTTKGEASLWNKMIQNPNTWTEGSLPLRPIKCK